jgi:superfamily I DNA/RNA helicase
MALTKIITGRPGCGKTYQLTRHAQEAVRNGADPKACIFLAYNRLTASQVALPNIQTTTLPLLGHDYIQRHHRLIGFTKPPEYAHISDAKKLLAMAEKEAGKKFNPTEPGYQPLVTKIYRKLLRKYNVIGYHDIGLEFSEMLTHPTIKAELDAFTHWFVDDAQDLFAEEWMFLRRIQAKLTLAGSLDASISSFRGANPNEFLALCASTPCDELLHNYRNRPWICRFSNQLLNFNKQRQNNDCSVGTSHITTQIFGVRVQDAQHQLNHLLRQTVECLKISPHVTVGIICRSYDDVLAIRAGLDRHRLEHRTLIFKSRLEEVPANQARITLGTIQEVRGQEFSVVIIPNCIEGIWPMFNDINIEESRRQFAYAVSRAKHLCYLLIPEQSQSGRAAKPSPFIQEGNTPELTVHNISS